MSLPWEQWETAVANALLLYSNEKTSTRQETLAWKHVFAGWKARVVTPGTDSPMRLLRADRPPEHAAAAWWTVLVEASGASWEPPVFELLRGCRGEYIETLQWTKSVDEALRRTEAKWDRQCNAFFNGTFPVTAAETLRRIERRLEDVIALRAHAATLLRAVIPTDEPEISKRAAQLYALDELEFERELKWVTQLRAALEGDAPLPTGTAYSYVDPIQHAEPEPEKDPFDFEATSTKTIAARTTTAVPVVGPSVDPFDFERVVSGTKP
jgi:hypothetical protein